MAKLTETDKAAFREFTERGWEQNEQECSPKVLAATIEARRRYCEWAKEAAKFFKGNKPVDFSGDHWKL